MEKETKCKDCMVLHSPENCKEIKSLSKKKINLYGKQCNIENDYYLDIDIKEFIRDIEIQNTDLGIDILDLVKVTEDKNELIIKLGKLLLAHKEERDKLAGKDLID